MLNALPVGVETRPEQCYEYFDYTRLRIVKEPLPVAGGKMESLSRCLRVQTNPSRREEVERMTLRIVGVCFVALALYILYEAGKALLFHEAPDRSVIGIIVAAMSIVVMPLLARAKRRAGRPG